jgi:hypothetical protein
MGRMLILRYCRVLAHPFFSKGDRRAAQSFAANATDNERSVVKYPVLALFIMGALAAVFWVGLVASLL